MNKINNIGNNYIYRKLCLLNCFFISILSSATLLGQTTIFSENMGTTGAGSNPPTSSYTGFQNYGSGSITYGGTSDLRNTTPSSGYTGASGTNNVFISNTVGNSFQISGISTSCYSSVSMSFGINKSTTSGTGADLIVEYSTDGVSFTSLSYTSLPTGSGTAIWYLRTVTGIPTTSNLIIRFRHTGTTTTLYRIDDIIISGSYSAPAISVSTTSLTNLNYNLGAGPSAYQSLNVSSTTLTGFPGNITLTAPPNFEISLSPDGPYSSTVDIPYTSATLASTPVYVQLSAGLSTATYNGNITISGGGGSCYPTISLSGTVSSTCGSSVSINSFTPTTGSAGNTITITGSGFTGATSVTIGSANATTFTVIDDNTITATVPTNATSGKIVVNVGSCNGISGTDFSMTYTSNSDIVIRTQFVNPCGPDANNEFIIANTLNATVNIANLGLTSSNGTDINWYWGGKNLPSNPYPAFSSGASETCGTSSLGCFSFLDPATTDSVSINAVINNLNTIAGCNVFRAVPADGNIPPVSNVIFILGAGGCGLSSPGTYLNFSNHCSAGSPLTQYFVVVGNGNTGCGAGGYFSNSSSRASTIFNYQGGGNSSGANYQSQTSAYTKPPSVSDNTTQAAVFVPDGKGGSKWVNNNGCIPLPSIILSELKFDFYILRKQEGLDLQWNFKAGEPIKEFVIERSTDMETFKQIISIPINQYNHAELELHYKDVQVQTGVQYYRVKAISQKGTIYFSSICRTMDNQISAAVRIYPNPVTNFLYVNYQTRGIFSFEIINTSGITLQRGTLSGQTKKIETNELKSGIYFIRFMDDSGLLLHAEKLYKQ